MSEKLEAYIKGLFPFITDAQLHTAKIAYATGWTLVKEGSDQSIDIERTIKSMGESIVEQRHIRTDGIDRKA
jgi:hypothetical protein|tara:strand:+ start:1527 stop:1742 length:216 start_codon:yes stop_codon:yes gene_type:complete